MDPTPGFSTYVHLLEYSANKVRASKNLFQNNNQVCFFKQIPALGLAGITLGTLYDFTTDSFLPAKLWTENELRQTKKIDEVRFLIIFSTCAFYQQHISSSDEKKNEFFIYLKYVINSGSKYKYKFTATYTFRRLKLLKVKITNS